MQTHAAVFRTGNVLEEGCQKIDEIYEQTEDLKVTAHGHACLNFSETKRKSLMQREVLHTIFTEIILEQRESSLLYPKNNEEFQITQFELAGSNCIFSLKL